MNETTDEQIENHKGALHKRKLVRWAKRLVLIWLSFIAGAFLVMIGIVAEGYSMNAAFKEAFWVAIEIGTLVTLGTATLILAIELLKWTYRKLLDN